MNKRADDRDMTFWEHLDELRSVLIKSSAILLVLMVAAFFCKKVMFEVILAPLTSEFVTYRAFDSLLAFLGLKPLESFTIEMINVDMTAQFFTHLRVAFLVALVISVPFIAYELWTFIRPALYENEKKAVQKSFGFAAIQFYLGVVVGYLLVLPLTVRFLGTYQVSPDVPNQINLRSYIGMFMSLILIMGIVFEMPVLAALLSRFGLINKQLLKEYRRHAIVILVTLAAIITPSGDAVTLFFVAVPLYLLYEVSIWVTRPAPAEDDEVDEEEPQDPATAAEGGEK